LGSVTFLGFTGIIGSCFSFFHEKSFERARLMLFVLTATAGSTTAP
jgi:hypothetical protein